MMAKKMKKIFSLILALSMVMSLVSVMASAEGGSGTHQAVTGSAQQIVSEGGKIYYLANGDEASAENYDVWTSKTIVGTDTENEFEITLRVGTTKKAESEDVAVILVMDASTSMLKDKNGKYSEYSNGWKDYIPVKGPRMIDYARDAAQEFVAGLVDHAGDASVKLAMVEFGNNAKTVFGWTEANNGGKVNNGIINSIEKLDVDFAIEDSERAYCPWVAEIENASFWGPVRDETGRCYYVEEDGSYCDLTDPFHTHNSKDAQVCYWVERDVSYMSCDKCADGQLHTHNVKYWVPASCSYEGCKTTKAHTHDVVCANPDCTTEGEHTHAENYWTAAHCAYDGCTNTTNSKETHAVYFLNYCNYVTETGDVCGKAGYHTHEGDGGHCTYTKDNQPCTDTTPYHYHKYVLTDGDAGNDPFGWADATEQRYVQTDANGKQHLCVDLEILRMKSCGTNMEGGLLLANNLLNAGLAEGGAIEGYENVYVILLSDGEPTFHVADGANKASTSFVAGEIGGGNKTLWSDVKNIVSDGTEGDTALAEEIKGDAAFYTIMYGYSGSAAVAKDAPEEIPAGTTVKTWLTTKNDKDENIKNMVGIDELYMAEDVESGLMEQFGNIGERIELLSKAWTVTDALSDSVIFDGFVKNGEYADYDKEDHAITWNVGDMEPEDVNAAGTVKDPYVYTLKYKVKLDPEAEGVYEASMDGSGVNTNKSAVLQYLMLDGDEDLKRLTYEELAERAKIAPFDHPAVKAFYADYSFTKKDGATAEALEGAGFTIYKGSSAWSSEVFSDENGQVSFERIPAGRYQLKETTVPEGMQAVSTGFIVSYGVLTKLNGSAMPDTINNWPVPVNPPAPPVNPPVNPPAPPVTPPEDPSEPPVEEEIPDEEVPTVDAPVEEEEIPEEDPPLADVPATGDMTALWMAASAVSAAGVLFLGKKNKDEE